MIFNNLTDKLPLEDMLSSMKPHALMESKTTFETHFQNRLDFTIGENGEYLKEETWRMWNCYCLGMLNFINLMGTGKQ